MTNKNIARKGKKRQGVHIRNDEKYKAPPEPDWTIEDNYAKYARKLPSERKGYNV